MPECNQSRFEFAAHYERCVTARFDGGEISSDGGLLLLREVDRRIGLLERFAGCFRDGRRPERIEHRLEELLAQRVYGLALGYEDVDDHDQLRRDPLLAVAAGRRELERPLAGKATLNRLEQAPGEAPSKARYHKIDYDPAAIDRLLVTLFMEAQQEPPATITLDLDATDTPLHGRQEGRFFHGYYRHYCYLPLYIFAGDHALCARLRTADRDPAAGAVEELTRIVGRIRERWPETQLVVRADSGFCREELLAWCEENRVDYVIGLARNERLRALIDEEMEQAAALRLASGRAAARVFAELRYQTRSSWSRERRVVAKAEQLEGKGNPRYVVTSLPLEAWPAQRLYEELYCARGEMENRIKEQLSLFADRLSTAALRSNQLRLYLSTMAYALTAALRRLALAGTEWARAQAGTLRLRLLKVAVEVRLSRRRVWLSIARGYPWKRQFQQAHAALTDTG